jgi:hypothetical protein
MTVDDPGEDVGQIPERVDVIQFAGFDQSSDGGPMLGAAVRTPEQCILSVERDRADRAFNGVVVELDAAVIEEARQAFPARQGVADGLGQFALLADQAKLGAEPGLERVNQRAASLLSGGATLVCTAAADGFLDDVERGDTVKRFLAIGDGPGVASS